jgi:hypothetical protein
LHLAETRLRQGAFARRELPRFHATVPPSDSRHGRPAVICSRRALHPQHALPLVHRAGSPRFLDGSVGARRPQSPRRARPLRVLVTSRSMAGFTLSGGMATLNGLTRPNQVHAFALRLTPLPHMASTDGSPRQPHDRLHGERAIAMVSTFQLTRSTRLCLAHRRQQSSNSRFPPSSPYYYRSEFSHLPQILGSDKAGHIKLWPMLKVLASFAAMPRC